MCTVCDARAAVYQKMGKLKEALRDSKTVIDLQPARWQVRSWSTLVLPQYSGLCRATHGLLAFSYRFESTMQRHGWWTLPSNALAQNKPLDETS